MKRFDSNQAGSVIIPDLAKTRELFGDVATDDLDEYVAKYGGEQPGLAEFLPQNAMFEVTPKVAFAVIEREAEFATRATRWRFS